VTEPHVEDYEDPEDFAEEVGVDPTPQQVDEYREETANRRPDDRADEAGADPAARQADEYREATDPTGGSGA
jgi:hypothetical protein